MKFLNYYIGPTTGQILYLGTQYKMTVHGASKEVNWNNKITIDSMHNGGTSIAQILNRTLDIF